jgi:branched-chain amino acid transport system ATP-binding protein
MLTLDGLVTGYASTPVLHGVSLDVPEGSITVVLGSNGAGKTTTLRASTGLLRPWRGTVSFEGRSIGRMAPEKVARLGVGMVPPSPGVFRDLSVVDNLRVGGFALGGRGREVARRLEEVLDEFPLLERRVTQLAGRLSGGEQRMLAVARALMGRPRLLLVDEASMGLSPTALASVLGMLQGLRERGISLCLVEQSPAALDIADRAFMMTKGRVVDAACDDRALGVVRARAAAIYLGTGGRR